MCADVNATNFFPQQIDEWRKHHNFGLLNIRFEIVNEVERAQHVLQRDRAHELDLGREIAPGNEILGHAGGVVKDQVTERCFYVSGGQKLLHIKLPCSHLVG